MAGMAEMAGGQETKIDVTCTNRRARGAATTTGYRG